jgi:hypothetical protein
VTTSDGVMRANLDGDFCIAGRLEGLREINHLDVLVLDLFSVVLLFREIGRRG